MKKIMNEIIEKLNQLNELLQFIPQDCKGPENSENRHKWMRIKSLIDRAIEEI